jgi:SAM-dependent methyltransferase
VLDLGDQPLANAYRHPGDDSPEPVYPLALFGCCECSLVQLTGTVPPVVMFDDYQYFSSYSSTMVEEMRVLAARTVVREGLENTDLVVEVASNDGYLLQHYQALGVPVLGIEPAKNVAAVAEAKGIPTVVRYFGAETAKALLDQHGPARVMHANNVMAHVPDINDFIAGFAVLLAEDGLAIVESPYLCQFVAQREFDTTYHEHVFYYSLSALDAAVRRHGLVVSDVEELPIHGGTLRCSLRRPGAMVAPHVDDLLAAEAALGVGSPGYYADLSARVEELKHDTVDLLGKLSAAGARIAAYGAAAKGTVLLNHFGIGRDLLEFVADRNPHKQGLLMPGTGIPVSDPSRLLEDMPTHVLLLVWNFAEEVLEQQAAYRAAGGKFIIPTPELRVV